MKKILFIFSILLSSLMMTSCEEDTIVEKPVYELMSGHYQGVMNIVIPTGATTNVVLRQIVPIGMTSVLCSEEGVNIMGNLLLSGKEPRIVTTPSAGVVFNVPPQALDAGVMDENGRLVCPVMGPKTIVVQDTIKCDAFWSKTTKCITLYYAAQMSDYIKCGFLAQQLDEMTEAQKISVLAQLGQPTLPAAALGTLLANYPNIVVQLVLKKEMDWTDNFSISI